MMKQISTKNAPDAVGKDAQTVKTGAFVFTSGRIALNSQTAEMETGGINAQTARVRDRQKAMLETARLLKDAPVEAVAVCP